MAIQQLKTRYLVIKLDLTNQISQPDNTTFSNGTTTKYIYAYSGYTGTAGMAYSRVDAVITQGISIQDNVATIDIYGMNISDINTFTRANLEGSYDVYVGNLITIYAGYQLNSDGLPPLVYCGYVIWAGPDYNVSRDRKFTIHSMQFWDKDNLNVKPYNTKGQISIDNIFRYLCQQGNYIYNGANVTGVATNPILTGTIRDQLQQAGKKYGYNVYTSRSPSDNQNIMFVSPVGQPFLQNNPPTLSAENNSLIGFPIVENFGFSMRCYFNPNLFIGQSVNVYSQSVPYINNKKLYINQMVHELHNRENPWQSSLQLNTWQGSISG